jgi:hypothetical protein
MRRPNVIGPKGQDRQEAAEERSQNGGASIRLPRAFFCCKPITTQISLVQPVVLTRPTSLPDTHARQHKAVLISRGGRPSPGDNAGAFFESKRFAIWLRWAHAHGNRGGLEACPRRWGEMQSISDAKRDAAECRCVAAAATNPQAAWQLLVIAEAWDKVIRAYEREHRSDPRLAPLW